MWVGEILEKEAHHTSRRQGSSGVDRIRMNADCNFEGSEDARAADILQDLGEGHQDTMVEEVLRNRRRDTKIERALVAPREEGMANYVQMEQIHHQDTSKH